MPVAKDRMTMTNDLSDYWERDVKDGKFHRTFTADTPNPQLNIEREDRISFGVTYREGRCRYFAQNLTRDCAIDPGIQEKKIPDTEIIAQYNGFRALRVPPPQSSETALHMRQRRQKADDCPFGCQNMNDSRSLHNRDPVTQIRTPNGRWNAYYNFAPFESEGHFIWVPAHVRGTQTILDHKDQRLTRAYAEDLCFLYGQSTGQIFFYNSFGAGASVNHIHFQSVAQRHKLAVEYARVSQHGAFSTLQNYPARCLVFDSNTNPDELFSYIWRLEDGEIPFNLVLVRNRLHLFVRDPRTVEAKTIPGLLNRNIASMELAGKFITDSRAVYDQLTANSITAALEVTTCDWKEIDSLFLNKLSLNKAIP